MTAPSHRLTGLCSYACRTLNGMFLADPVGREVTCFMDQAYLWLWTPESADLEARKIKTIRGAVVAVRGRQ